MWCRFFIFISLLSFYELSTLAFCYYITILKSIHDILKENWGYSDFRPLQQSIIESVLDGKDTLGLMPTGGGKSLTFQVSALAMEGICLVVTPLIALMKDQVENLKAKNIKAAAIYSGMSAREILITLENAVFGAYKFLYLSPERLNTTIFKAKVEQMKVALIAVDESHCISQWGYDFRPAYLKIADIRELFPQVPVLALTATATEEVVEDIQKQLKFEKQNVFRKSFARDNLAYIVRNTEKKEETLLNILNSVQGTSVVYVRNRKKTKEIAQFLVQNGISAENYHAGINPEEKDARQERWKLDKTRVIVCTNAFGMGIDKPNVRTVVHLDLPDSLEAYFQEAGRAGRDEKKAYAVLLFNKSDETKLKKRIADTFPPKKKIKEIYDALGNYYEVAVGYGLESVFVFDLIDFCKKFKQPMLVTHNAIKILEQAGYLYLTDEEDSRSLVKVIVKKEELYKKDRSEKTEKVLHTLLRSYTGLFADLIPISEETLSKRTELTTQEIYEALVELARIGIIQFIPRKKTPFLHFTHERVAQSELQITAESYDDRKKRYVKRVTEMLHYAQSEYICRSKLLLRYFGEENAEECGSCDVCLKKKKEKTKDKTFYKIKTKIINLLKEEKDLYLKEIAQKVGVSNENITPIIRYLRDARVVVMDKTRKYKLSKDEK